MTRTRESAKAAGSRAERAVADYLKAALRSDYIDRRVKTGAKDRGDISGVRAHGHPVVVEVKDVSRMALSEWVAEAEAERDNDGALAGVVVHKRRGRGDPGAWYVTLTLGDLAALLSGRRAPRR